MPTYVIGDLQGCFDDLIKLLDHIDYQPGIDELWFAGDIVNRGPKSLECLRFVKEQQDLGYPVKMVLGNHDIHLLSAYCGVTRYQSKSDTLLDILNSPDATQLINWLRKQPLILLNKEKKVALVHAGIPPQWTFKIAMERAHEVEKTLQSDDWKNALKNNLFGNHPKIWHDDLEGWDRQRYILNAFTRMRMCKSDGKLSFSINKPSTEHPDYHPWFMHSSRQNTKHAILFGHWSALGEVDNYGIHSTDTGCLWGGKLTAFCLETQYRHTVSCPKHRQIKH